MSDGTKPAIPVMNIADVPLKEQVHGDKFAAKIGSFGKAIGSTGIGVMLHVVPPGKRAWQFHNHHVLHELFVILEGTGTYRLGKDTYAVKAGDVLAAPAGNQDVAHQLINTGTTDLKYLGFSTSGATTEVVEYPDTGKLAVTAHWDPATKTGLRTIQRPGPSLDYWDGE